MNIGQSIREIRKSKGLNQKQLSERCGMSFNALCQIETGRTLPQRTTLNKICVILNVPVSYIYFNSLDEKDVQENKIPVFKALKKAIMEFLLN
jgi:transcriptional regulator with XRE-family HTH domain